MDEKLSSISENLRTGASYLKNFREKLQSEIQCVCVQRLQELLLLSQYKAWIKIVEICAFLEECGLLWWIFVTNLSVYIQ